MQLKTALFIWLGLFIGLFVVAKICSAVGLTQWITFIYYIGAGVFLSKKVLANLITWDGTIHNTIDNVSGAKLLVEFSEYFFFVLFIFHFLN